MAVLSTNSFGSFTNPSKSSSKQSSQNSIYIGIVTRIIDGKVIVKIPKLNPSTEFGPCMVFGNFPSVGDYVACSYIDNRYENIIVFGSKIESVPGDIRNTQIMLFMEVF